MKQQTKAWMFASKKHYGQKDDEGKDYFTAHLVPVVGILLQVTEDDELLAAGYLHDTLEDTNTTIEELYTHFGKRITDIVMECTHEGAKDTYGYYFPRLKSKEAIMIKFADHLSNMSRMSAWDEKRQAQFLRKSKFWKSEPYEIGTNQHQKKR